MNGIMGFANAQRTLDYIRTIVEFVSQPEYVDLIPMFSIVNEALLSTIGRDPITSFYLNAHNMIREITGLGEGNGPFMVIHDGFLGVDSWKGFLQGSDRIAIDTHPYFAFDGQPNTAPIDVPLQGSSDPTQFGGQWPSQACNAWGATMNIRYGAVSLRSGGARADVCNAAARALASPSQASSATRSTTAGCSSVAWATARSTPATARCSTTSTCGRTRSRTAS